MQTVPTQCFEFGIPLLNTQIYFAMIDMDKSTALNDFARKWLGFSTKEGASAFLIMERAFDPSLADYFGRPIIRQGDTLLLVRRDEAGVTLSHTLTSSATQSIEVTKLLQEPPDDIDTIRDLGRAVDRALPGGLDIAPRGLDNYLLARKDSTWGAVPYSLSGRMLLSTDQFDRRKCGLEASYTLVNLGEFERSRDINDLLTISLIHPYGQFFDVSAGLVLPGPSVHSGDGDYGDYAINMANLVENVGSGGGGGGGASTQPSESSHYGWATCKYDNPTRADCYTCCDTQAAFIGGSVVGTVGVAAGIQASTGVGVAPALATLAIGLVAGAALYYITSTGCKDLCRQAWPP